MTAPALDPGKRVLDVGCGWGANLEFLSRDMGVADLTGITLSKAQFAAIEAKRIPGVKVECVSYKDYQPERPFDAVISIGMFEHIATPGGRRARASTSRSTAITSAASGAGRRPAPGSGSRA